MTDQSSGTGRDVPVRQFNPLPFVPIPGNGDLTVYQAPVEAQNSPGSPLFAVTVSIASSIADQAPEAVQALLAGMQASFILLAEPLPEPPPEPPSGSGGSGDGETVDFNTQLLIEISLASSDSVAPADVAVDVAVKTTTPVVPLPIRSHPTGGAVAPEDRNHTVSAGLNDCWRAKPKKPFLATVTPSLGAGTISNKVQTVDVSPDNPGQLTGTDIIVEGGIETLTYAISGPFRLRRHNVHGTDRRHRDDQRGLLTRSLSRLRRGDS